MENEWKRIDELATALSDRFGDAPRVLLVLGSGLGAAADELQDHETLEVGELPGWPQSTVAGHAGLLHVGTISGVRALLQQGRCHLYEGYSPAEVVRPVRAAITWG